MCWSRKKSKILLNQEHRRPGHGVQFRDFFDQKYGFDQKVLLGTNFILVKSARAKTDRRGAIIIIVGHR